MSSLVWLCTLLSVPNGPIAAGDVVETFRWTDRNCGPASLYWAARYYDREVDLEQLLSRCEDSQGCSIEELCKMAKEIGLSATVRNLKTESLPELRMPAIVLYPGKEGEVGHFFFVIGTGSGSFIYADTMWGAGCLQPRDMGPEARDTQYPAILLALDRAPPIPAAADLPSAPSGFLSNLEALLALTSLAGAVLVSRGILHHRGKCSAGG